MASGGLCATVSVSFGEAGKFVCEGALQNVPAKNAAIADAAVVSAQGSPDLREGTGLFAGGSGTGRTDVGVFSEVGEAAVTLWGEGVLFVSLVAAAIGAVGSVRCASVDAASLAVVLCSSSTPSASRTRR